MALGSSHETATTLASYIPDVWGQKMNDYFKEYLVAAEFFVDRSDELAGGGITLETPNLGTMTANTKTNGSQITLNAPTDTKITLTVNVWKECSFLVEDREAAQYKRSYSLQDNYAKNAGFQVAEALEIALMTLFSGFSATVGSSTANVGDSDIRNAIATLASNKVTGMLQNGSPKQDVAFFVHPNTFWKQIQGIDKFSLAINSPSNDPTAKWPQGFLYGIPVFVSPNVTLYSASAGRVNALAHRDALHFATLALGVESEGGMVGDKGIRVQSNYIAEYLGTLTTADICYGTIENRDNAGVFIKSVE